MLNATAQKLGDSTVLRCQGRIVMGDAYAILRNAVLGQTHTQTLILDLAQVDRIDAGGLGVLLGLREWAYSQSIRFQLMNVMNHVEHVLELTKLDCVFEFCSVEDVLHLLHSAAAIAPRSVDQANQRITRDNCKYLVEGQDAPPAAQRNSLLAGTAARDQELAGVPADVAERHLAEASSRGRTGRFQLEAAIQSVHAERARSGRTEWAAILLFSDQLIRISPTLGTRTGYAAAVAEAGGPEAGLALLEEFIAGCWRFWNRSSDCLRDEQDWPHRDRNQRTLSDRRRTSRME